jgi:organic radical activating enzyme
MNISINPTYYCNFRCDFCYLTQQQLGDNSRVSVDRIAELLAEISAHEPIQHIDLYGGEIGLLPLDYLQELRQCLELYGVKSVNVNTNLSVVHEIFQDPYWLPSVSYDSTAREQSDRVWRNMLLLDREFSIIILASQAVINLDIDAMIAELNLLKNLVSVEIKPYSANQANQQPVGNLDYEDFVRRFITSPVEKSWELVNEHYLAQVINGTRNSFSNDHIYITPAGKFAVLEFDLNDREYFLELATVEDYYQWCDQEYTRVSKNKYCGDCQYFGRCLSEHLREVRDIESGCNGFKNLVQWWEQYART